MQYDLIIRNGTVIDGSGATARRADIAVTGGKISELGVVSAAGIEEIDASGLCVTPGFIDVNSHSAYTLLVDPRAVSALYQGVTLEVVGNCGHGCFPIGDPHLARHSIYGFNGMVPLDWTTGAQYMERLAGLRPGINIATLVPNGQLRTTVMGFSDRPANESEQQRMQQLLEESLEAGAWGLSVGLEYPAEAGVSEAELTRLCRAVGRRGGIFATHVRERDTRAVEGIREVVRIAAAAEVRLQISHLLPRTGPEICAECVDEVEKAQRSGLPIAFDMHTRTYGTTYLRALLPPAVVRKEAAELAAQLRRRSVRRSVRTHRSIIGALGDWSRVIIFDCPWQTEYSRRSLADIAAMRSQDVYDAACDLIIDECEKGAGYCLMVIMPSYTEEELFQLQTHPLCVPTSNGTTMGTDGLLAGTVFHGTYTWAGSYYRCLVRERRLMSAEEAIHHLTGLPAQIMGIADRGVLKVGNKADIAIFDAARFTERGTLFEPSQLSEGMRYVLVNGVVSLREGVLTEARGGCVLRH